MKRGVLCVAALVAIVSFVSCLHPEVDASAVAGTRLAVPEHTSASKARGVSTTTGDASVRAAGYRHHSRLRKRDGDWGPLFVLAGCVLVALGWRSVLGTVVEIFSSPVRQTKKSIGSSVPNWVIVLLMLGVLGFLMKMCMDGAGGAGGGAYFEQSASRSTVGYGEPPTRGHLTAALLRVPSEPLSDRPLAYGSLAGDMAQPDAPHRQGRVALANPAGSNPSPDTSAARARTSIDGA
ncbi:hypothetical protein SeMB42_g06668 [Synchytrium endobioticum]|nr:hypothetical protein SeMB42_g06668 [Synchytrium endobioticum]